MGKSSTHKSDFSKNGTPDSNYLKSFSETSECFTVFIPCFVSFGVCIYAYFFHAVR